jgi:tellurite resistance protein TerC
LKITPTLEGQHFFVFKKNSQTQKKELLATPLLPTLVLIEIMDLFFAMDSIPAIFSITTNSYVIYTSNIFAILGLRALYFALTAIIHRFAYLKYALAIILIFIGAKTVIADVMGMEKFPVTLSLSVTFSILTVGILFSLYKTR